jgi:hypothetical protein
MYISFILSKILIILLIIEIYPYENCNYSLGNLSDFLGNNTNIAKEKCFSLSYSFGNGECCYNKTSKNCVNNVNSTQGTEETPGPALTTEPSSESEILDSSQSNDIITNKLLLRNVEGSDDNFECPKKNTLEIHNNCGMAGIYMPDKNTTCNEISLVQGYCCFIKIEKEGEEYRACLRAKQLNKDKSKAPAEIQEYVNSKGGEIKLVECGKFNLKLYWTLNFILSIIYLF